MTKEKLLEIDEHLEDQDNFDGWAYFEYTKEEPLEVLGVQIWSEDQHGGMGQGDDFWQVIAVKDGEEVTYWKIPGWYQSHHGAEIEFYNIFEVKPKEKMITVWVSAKTGKE